MKKQDLKYIDSNITQVFHFLELKGHHNFLIGSNKIRNILYQNDYDLNSNLQINDTIPILNKVYQEFLHIFDTAHANPDYYIIDFKCGVHNGEPIRWSYHDLTKGMIKCGKHMITFEECLLMEDNIIKLDMCYLYNNVFTDINCLYNLYMVNNKNDLMKEKAKEENNISEQLKTEIKELEHNKEFYKAMKRHFSLGLNEGKFDKDILTIMNSDYGMFYKLISFLKLVVEMIEQKFKPIEINIIKSNLEYIKQFASHITDINIDTELNKLVKIISLSTEPKIKIELNKLIIECSTKLDKLINKVI